MLTADLLRVRVRDGRLTILPIAKKLTPDLGAYASQVLEKLRFDLGMTRAAILESCAGIPPIPKEHKLCTGILRTALDLCEWLEADSDMCQSLREEVFLAAASERKEKGIINRDEVVRRVALSRHVEPSEVERDLYGDLKEHAKLAQAPTTDASHLLESYEATHARSVLVFARTISIAVPRTRVRDLSAIIRKIKFLGLLFSWSTTDDRVVLEVDGPLSEFGAGSKYGTAFANVVPLLTALGSIQITAKLRWRAKDVSYVVEAKEADAASPLDPPVEVQSLLSELLAKSVDACISDEVLFSRQSLFTPDIEVILGNDKVHVEIVEGSSRESVFRRLDVARMLPDTRFALCYPARLRIAEDIADRPANVALYSYRGSPIARPLIERIERLLTQR